VIKILIYLWFLFKIVCLQHYNQHLDHFSVTQPLTLLLHDDTIDLVGNNLSMQPTPLWSVGKITFLHDLYV